MTDPAIAGLSGQRVLVTGGAGVIGTELLAQLSDAGAEVLSIDRLPLSGLPAGVRHLRDDLATVDLAPVVAFRPRHVVHLAATFERSAESPEFWSENWHDNVVVSHRLAEASERAGDVETFVFASSYLVYDPALYQGPQVPTVAISLPEDARLRPRNLCGAAKLYAEAEIDFMRRVRRLGFRTIHARIFRSYGRGSRDVVSRWVRAALAGEEIEVYHPENRFDYVFAGDVAAGLLRMAVAPAAEGPINLASGRARPVSAVIDAIEGATGTRLRARTRDVDEPYEASQADLARLLEVTGWSPPTDVEGGVSEIVEFERRGSMPPSPAGLA